MRHNLLYLTLASLLTSFATRAQFTNKGIMTIDSTGIVEVTMQGDLATTGTLINNGTLLIRNQLANNSNMNGTGKVVVNNTGGSFPVISGTGRINTLEINTSATALLLGNQSISDALILTKGILDNTGGGELRLLSTPSKTARVARVVAGSITGPIAVERYIPAGRYQRLLTAPVSFGDTIRKSWQNNKVYTAGKGMFIKGSGGTNGLDTGSNYSVTTYDINTQQWKPLTNTNVPISANTTSAANRCYFAFIAGDRNPLNHTAPNTNATTLTAMGKLQTGNQKFFGSSLGGNKAVVGNPYPSPVDFGALVRVNIKKRFYVWDADLNTVGGFVLIDDADNDGTYTVTPASNLTNIIQSGQAIMIETGVFGTSSITFTEASKTTGSSIAPFRISKNNAACTINLHRKNEEDNRMIDGVAVYFSKDYNNGTDDNDASKMMNPNENIAINRDGKQWCMEKRNMPAESDEVAIYLSNLCEGNYELHISFSNMNNVLTPYLVDDYLKTSTQLSLTGTNIITVKIDNQNKAAQTNRYRIVYQTSKALWAVTTKPATVITANEKAVASIYPNPVEGKTINLRLQNTMSNYTVTVRDETGRLFVTRQLNHAGGSANYTIKLPATLPVGVYRVSITSAHSTNQIAVVVR